MRPGSGVTPRHILTLLTHLPEGSAYVAARLGGPEFRSWTTQTEIAAQTRDVKYKKPLPRPGSNRRRVATLDEALPI